MKRLLPSLAFFGVLTLAVAAFGSEIPYRGVVEGYYGRPWGTEGRSSLLSFMVERGLNTFVYGPKDDPYHHVKWREPYPAKEAADFKRLLAEAKKRDVTFFWAIHLGGFKDEYEALFTKLESMHALGVRAFGVFFDDFGSADAELHVTIANRVVREFLDRKGDCAPLLVCPNVYWGSGHPYQRTLGEKTDPRVMLMWTGAAVCGDVTAADVKKITADYRRPPFVWWNWPVNDYCRHKVLLGRLYGIESAAYAGFVINPMENCEANKIALHSFADWCRDPAGFDSQKSWETSFAKLYRDPSVASAMRVFATHNSDHDKDNGYSRFESEGYTEASLEAMSAADRRALFVSVDAAAATLLERLPAENPKLAWELEGWLREERSLMAEGLLAEDFVVADKAGRAKLLERLREIRRVRRENAERHVARFKAATFENDRQYVVRPLVSTKVLKPFIEKRLARSLAAYLKETTGRDFDLEAGVRPFATSSSFRLPAAKSDGYYAGLSRGLEAQTLAPGEAVGVTIPASWKAPRPAFVLPGLPEGIEPKEDVTNGCRRLVLCNGTKEPFVFKLDCFGFELEEEHALIDDLLLALDGSKSRPEWEDLSVNSVNRLPPRTYAMPLADEQAALTDELEPSTPYVKSLNGTWKLSWAGNPTLRERYLAYGGDWDEKPHLGPFCCNGVIGPLREVRILSPGTCFRSNGRPGPCASNPFLRAS